MKNRIKVLIPIGLLSMFTGCVLAMPTTILEFVAATAFSMMFWCAFFIGAIIDGK
jgi:hypothetical protein